MGMIRGRLYQLVEHPLFPLYIDLVPWAPDGYFDVASQEDMVVIDDWCQAHECGKRSGYNKFFFDTPEQMTMFKLRWA
jgi:hypothetical protein